MRNKVKNPASVFISFDRILSIPAALLVSRYLIGESNRIQTHNHLVRKQTLNNVLKLAKRLSCVVAFIYMLHLTICD